MTRWFGKAALACGLAIGGTASASAEIYNGVDFPQGAISFADSVVSYTLTSGTPGTPYQGSFNALGIPNYNNPSCASQATCTFVSLGQGGSLVAQFLDNVLTGSDNADLDLWIFEVGPAVEGTAVDVSSNGTDWFSIGSVGGSISGIDLDAFGYGTGSQFSFVRLTDSNPPGGSASAGSTGADIDAIGAISTRPAGAVPEPATWAMMIAGFGFIGWRMRRKNPATVVRYA